MQNTTCWVFHYEYVPDKTKEKPGKLSFISKKIRTTISADFFPFLNSILPSNYYLAVRCGIINRKFNTRVYDFKLILPWNWTHVVLNSHHLPVHTYHNNFRLTLSNFFGECEVNKSKLHNIVLTLLLWVWTLSVGAKSSCA